ncbi:AT-rich interactive domain-containing protein 4 [Cynara cardunculus var. scolymus]|uniref:AT-rich interactive domain-containing protein 4 n=1 Tax=Cynara cardunculus var. scolymus TaxID=59895 RepID=UPI000D62C7E6|nr:AT-rich interactive domain-containing protein 4 [Cynara cardunculus var. scolymus]XP_024971328.1 AT-rich interactive domain-containing protein 4 [Cynara cardunculus var. scolymus]
MFHAQGTTKHTCCMLAVLCGRNSNNKDDYDVQGTGLRFPFPEITSSGRLEVQTLNSPTIDEFRKVLDSVQPNIVYLQGERLPNDDVGSLAWEGAEDLTGVFGSSLPTTIYLEFPDGEKVAEELHSKGVPYVIYWKNAFSCYTACHFRHALFSVVQSSSSHTWDAFQLAHSSYRLYCVRNNHVLHGNPEQDNSKLGPCLLGDPPKINVPPPEAGGEDDEEKYPDDLPAIKIYDDDVNVRFLVCGSACMLDASLLEPLEDGLNALLSIEMRGSKLHNRVSALPPPLQAGTFSRGVVTMRCDISTCSSAYISLLVSGSAQTCFDDQLLENHIKSEVIEKTQLVQAVSTPDENKLSSSEPRGSVSIACGATVCEVSMKVPLWASQVLRQLAPDVTYRSLVVLGVASVQGLAVASFEKDDADRLLFFCKRLENNIHSNIIDSPVPTWMRQPFPSRKRSITNQEMGPGVRNNGLVSGHRSGVKQEAQEHKVMESANGYVVVRQKPKVAALRPIPHIRHQKMLPFAGISEANGHEFGGQVKTHILSMPSGKHNGGGSAPVTHRKSLASSYQAKQLISLNPLPLKKHGCDRSPIHVCSEEEFLKDVMQFLILRGHNRLIPQGGLAEFPDAILNAKRLDLYNLYREVVSRGGFHVGNGINWKGQVFSKMRNHTVTNRMTGVGNTLKRHYETYLLEYELAHDDVDGECCLLCHSSAAGDWVNCGICGEWAHFGCDRRQGLGAFKDYAKTDGLEYICPQCSISNFKKKLPKTTTTNGYS